MMVHPVSATPATRGVLGALKSWLQAWSNETGREPDHPPINAARPPQHCYGSARVLVVDDNPVNLMAISALMEARGLVPLLAADGAEAVALACEIPFDLILMDLQMPILDGLAATAAIRRFEGSMSLAEVPVLAYSGTLPSARVLRIHGLNGSLPKPCEDQDLEDCLDRWCPGYRSAPSTPVAAPTDPAWLALGRTPGATSTALR